MKILQLLGNTAFGGATLIVSKISQKLRDEGHEVIVMANDQKTKEHFQSLGFICDDIKHMGRNIHPYNDLMSVFALKTYVTSNHIDVIHSHTTKGGIYSRALKMIYSKCLVVHTVHGYYLKMDGSRSDKVTLFIERLFHGFADHTTYVNTYDYDLAKMWSKGSKNHLIFNGIDIEKFRPVSHAVLDPITIGISARIVHEKGYSEFMDLINHYKNHDNIQFEILGEGPDEVFYKNEVCKIFGVNHVNQQSKVLFHGYSNEVKKVIGTWAINVLPSYREGLSISLLEALALGIPSVATNIRGNNEIIENGVSGLLYEARNSTHLIEKVDELVNNPDLMMKISFESRKQVEERFDQIKMLESYVHIFANL